MAKKKKKKNKVITKHSASTKNTVKHTTKTYGKTFSYTAPKSNPCKVSPKILKEVAEAFDIDRLKYFCQEGIDDIFKYLQENLGGVLRGRYGEQHCYVNCGADILAIGHLDTVQDQDHFAVARLTDETLIYCPKLDDRLGIYTILDLLPKLGITTDLLLTENEEVGMSTAKDFDTNKEYNFIVEFDRTGTDVVTYDYEWEYPLNEHFTLGLGSFSDICYLEHLGVKGMNVGIGYYNEHSKRAFFVLPEFLLQIARYVQFHRDWADTRFEHEPYSYGYTTDPYNELNNKYGVSNSHRSSVHDDINMFPDYWEERARIQQGDAPDTDYWCDDCAIYVEKEDVIKDANDIYICPDCNAPLYRDTNSFDWNVITSKPVEFD